MPDFRVITYAIHKNVGHVTVKIISGFTTMEAAETAAKAIAIPQDNQFCVVQAKVFEVK